MLYGNILTPLSIKNISDNHIRTQLSYTYIVININNINHSHQYKKISDSHILTQSSI